MNRRASILCALATACLVLSGCVVPPTLARFYPELERLESARFVDRQARFAAAGGSEVAITGVARGCAEHAGHLLVVLSHRVAGDALVDRLLVLEDEAALADFYTYVTGRPLPDPDAYDEDGDGSLFISDPFGR